MKVLVIIPAFNEAAVIGSVVQKVKNEGFSVLVVDDGSSDQTSDQAKLAKALVVKHTINLGQGAALQTGFAYALQNDYQAVITFDADDQHEVKDIKRILQPLLAGQCEVVLGSRFLNSTNKIPVFKKLILKLAVIFTRLTTGLTVTDAHNGLRALTRSVLQKIKLEQNGMAHASEIISQIAKLKISYCEVPVTIYYTNYSRQKGQSIFNSFKILGEIFWQKIN
ncbi:MAG: glycosyltransferase family 2 protein [Candidatus Buchananbacteria bacterium]